MAPGIGGSVSACFLYIVPPCTYARCCFSMPTAATCTRLPLPYSLLRRIGHSGVQIKRYGPLRRKRSCLPLSKSMLYLAAPVRAKQIFRIFCVTAFASLCTHYSGCVGRDLSGQEDEDPNRPVSSYGGRPNGCCNPPMSDPGGRPSGCGLRGVKCTGQNQSLEESPSASSIAGGLRHSCRAWQSSWQLCQSRLQFPVSASTKGGGPGLRPQNLRWQRFLAGRKRRCRAGMKNDIPGAGRRARAARRLPGSLPACFRHRGPTVGLRPVRCVVHGTVPEP